MQTCKTCKWWCGQDINEGWGGPPVIIGVCQNTNSIRTPMQFGSDMRTPSSAQGISAGPMGVLPTGPNFGCIHHEPKEAEHGEQG